MAVLVESSSTGAIFLEVTLIVESLPAFDTAFHGICEAIISMLELLLELLWSKKR